MSKPIDGYLMLAADLLTAVLLDYAVCWRVDKRFISAQAFLASGFGELCMVALGADPETVRDVADRHRATFQECVGSKDAARLHQWRREYFPESIYLTEVEKRLRAGKGIQPPTSRRATMPRQYRREVDA